LFWLETFIWNSLLNKQIKKRKKKKEKTAYLLTWQPAACSSRLGRAVGRCCLLSPRARQRVGRPGSDEQPSFGE
jgi:hypothetical protein